MKKLKVGLIGLGEQMCTNLIPAIRLLPHCEITAICDINVKSLNKVSIYLGIQKKYTDFDKMINDENLDVIFSASTPDVHYKVAKKALSKKIPFFLEKPAVLNLTKLHKLIDLGASQIINSVGMNFSYTDSHETINRIKNTPNFGNLLSIYIEHLSSKPQTPFWNLNSVVDSFLLSQLIHPLDYILRLGGEYDKISVYCSNSTQPLFINILISFKNNVIGQIKSGTCFPRFRHKIEIISDKSNIISVEDLHNIELSTPDFKQPFLLRNKKCSIIEYNSPLQPKYNSHGYEKEVACFINAVLKKEQHLTSLASQIVTYKALKDIKSLILKNMLKNKADII